MASPTHRIRSLAIELSLIHEAEARSLMDRVATLRQPRLEHCLDGLFAELSPPGRLDRLDRLDLNLGTLPIDGFEAEFLRRLEPALRQALTEPLAHPPVSQPAQSPCEILRFFALTGTLPWWADRDDPALIGFQVRALLKSAPDAWWALLAELQAQPIALLRLTAACDAATLEALCSALGVDFTQAQAQAHDPNSNLPAPPQRLLVLAARGLRGTVLRQALRMGASEQSQSLSSPASATVSRTGSAQGEMQPVDADLNPLAESDWGVPSASTPSATSSSPAMSVQPGSLPAKVEPTQPIPDHPVAPDFGEAASRVARAALRPAPASSLDTAASAQNATPYEAAIPRFPSPSADSVDSIDPDELVVDNGGMVILWPFLQTLFSRLELLDSDQARFPNEKARALAIAMLAFLVEGDPEPLEWRLPLAKVICGGSPLAFWPPPQPLAPPAQVEAERLLEAVVAHAGLAGRFGAQELRTTFLQRSAILTTRPGAWLLRVERRPEDVLLPRFPWGWSWLRLPWMDHPMQVEW